MVPGLIDVCQTGAAGSTKHSLLKSKDKMKTITCRQLGGPCDLAHTTKTADEAIQSQDKHLKAAIADGDETHREAADAMAARWRNPIKGLGWYRSSKKFFAGLPED